MPDGQLSSSMCGSCKEDGDMLDPANSKYLDDWLPHNTRYGLVPEDPVGDGPGLKSCSETSKPFGI